RKNAYTKKNARNRQNLIGFGPGGAPMVWKKGISCFSTLRPSPNGKPAAYFDPLVQLRKLLPSVGWRQNSGFRKTDPCRLMAGVPMIICITSDRCASFCVLANLIFHGAV